MPDNNNKFVSPLLICSFVFSLAYNSRLGENILFLSLSVIAIILVILLLLWNAQTINLPRTSFFYFLLLFSLWTGLSQLWSISPFTSEASFWATCAFGLVSLTIIFNIRNSVLNKAIFTILGIIFILCLFGLGQFFTEGTKPQSFFLNPNTHSALVNMLALPFSVFMLYLLSREDICNRRMPLVLTGFIIFYAVAISQSRGVILAFSIALAFVFYVSWRQTTRHARLVTLFSVVVAFLAANIYSSGTVTDRLESLADPTSAGSDRIVIWKAGIEMLKDNPVIGSGIGTFWLVYPQYRSATDDSGGFHVHNDYLQLAIETGMPGVLLYLFFIASLALIVFRVLGYSKLSVHHRYEIIAFSGALLTLFIHSLFTFNFYILPIMLLAGLYLVRIHAVYTEYFPDHVQCIEFTSLPRPVLFKILVFVLVGILAIQILMFGLAAWYNEKGKQAALAGKIENSEELLRMAIKLEPSSDAALFSLADLYRQAMQTKGIAEHDQKLLYQDAHQLLEQARAANPVRPQVYLLLGKLYAENPSLDPQWYKKSHDNFMQALKYDPRFFPARMQLALLLKKEQSTQARKILEDGLVYNYPLSDKKLEYYAMVARMRFEDRDIKGGMAMAEKVDELLRLTDQSAEFSTSMKKIYNLR